MLRVRDGTGAVVPYDDVCRGVPLWSPVDCSYFFLYGNQRDYLPNNSRHSRTHRYPLCICHDMCASLGRPPAGKFRCTSRFARCGSNRRTRWTRQRSHLSDIAEGRETTIFNRLLATAQSRSTAILLRVSHRASLPDSIRRFF